MGPNPTYLMKFSKTQIRFQNVLSMLKCCLISLNSKISSQKLRTEVVDVLGHLHTISYQVLKLKTIELQSLTDHRTGIIERDKGITTNREITGKWRNLETGGVPANHSGREMPRHIEKLSYPKTTLIAAQIKGICSEWIDLDN